MNRNYDVIVFVSEYLNFKKAWSSHSCRHHQNYDIFIKAIFKRILKNLKRITKMQSLSVFLDIAKLADFWRKNADVSRKQGCVT